MHATQEKLHVTQLRNWGPLAMQIHAISNAQQPIAFNASFLRVRQAADQCRSQRAAWHTPRIQHVCRRAGCCPLGLLAALHPHMQRGSHL
jgi:hypothetical protein